ncbi:uncharacterized protein OCT59_008161 [Rhizophagus irregularis]|uniref:uncharacterized protein n=1 Tax=Rhizophagus irregularis TaxID=588596 RepID=UPI003331CB5A|nr:hypothetical protein OCT59_008161 [Rhizophagus irregularis]
MSTYTEFASIVNSNDSTSEEQNQLPRPGPREVYQANPDGKFSCIICEVRGQKTLPDNAAYTANIAKIRESYKNKQALLDKLEALFELYYNATKDSSTSPPKRAITKNEAEKTLTELLA